MQHENRIISKELFVKGRVQGVGFRPFVYRLAVKHHITGYVYNRTDGVMIRIEGEHTRADQFISELSGNAPPAMNISAIDISIMPNGNFRDFAIRASHDVNDILSEVSPDIAVCDDCLNDMKHQTHRLNYPFINCTNCGPRFTIIKDYPYDRKNTSMADFFMCKICNDEYSDIADRRFHAQPIACNHCGPEYELIINGKPVNDFQKILYTTGSLIDKGMIVAIKGLGGFFFACNALDKHAVSRLRKAKQREGKPFAVMFRDIDAVKQYSSVTPDEKSSLLSWRRPIVLLNSKNNLPPETDMGFTTLGAFLPYMPLHHLLFEQLKTPAIVLTSGNLSDDPIVTANKEAMEVLGPVSDAVLTNNRDIVNRTDDSVVRIMNREERVFRRSRGYVPEPLSLPFSVDNILAMGAELVNCFCVGKGNDAILSQHIGDLKNSKSFDFYEESIKSFIKLFRVKTKWLAADMHPDYFSTRYAEELDKPVIRVQHHHAHLASCMAEHQIDEPVIGICFDGTGYGDDGHTWGSEFMICDLANYRRVTHFDYIPLPGGDKVVEEPWRTAVSCLYTIYDRELADLDLPFLKTLDPEKLDIILRMLEKNINCPLSDSAGRLFDAVAALINCCTVTSFHAEAPMRLENLATENTSKAYTVELNKTLSFSTMIRQIVEDLQNNTAPAVIATKFHNTITRSVLETTKMIASETGLHTVALSGGTFQNKYLLEKLEKQLTKEGYKVLTHKKIPCNDGGIALGQLVIAAKRVY